MVQSGIHLSDHFFLFSVLWLWVVGHHWPALTCYRRFYAACSELGIWVVGFLYLPGHSGVGEKEIADKMAKQPQCSLGFSVFGKKNVIFSGKKVERRTEEDAPFFSEKGQCRNIDSRHCNIHSSFATKDADLHLCPMVHSTVSDALATPNLNNHSRSMTVAKNWLGLSSLFTADW